MPRQTCKAAVKEIMDYMNVGSNGFAQMGSPDFNRKMNIEMTYLFKLITEKFPIPEILSAHCRFAVKRFNHEFGTYKEIVLHYDDDKFNEQPEVEGFFPNMSAAEIQNCFDNDLPVPMAPPSLGETFWDWFRSVEDFDTESEEITEAISAIYIKSLDLENAEHLTVIQKRRAS